MQYINPIEILGLSNVEDVSSLENETIKKEKRKLFAEIDLSDNAVFDYHGILLTKGSCEKVIEELSNNDYKEFYLYLAKNKPLNEFLVNGNTNFFQKITQDSIFKLPEFVRFISPYFAVKFDKALLNAFENYDISLVKSILLTSSLISTDDLNSSYKSVSNSLQNKIFEIDKITKDIKNEESDYNEVNVQDITPLVKKYFPVNTINCLPEYFQSQILKIADSINFLSNAIWSAYDSTKVSYDLTQYLLKLNIGGLDRPTFENNFKIIKKKYDEEIEQEKNEPFLKKWAEILIKLKKVSTSLKNKEVTHQKAFKSISIFSTEELNKLPSFANEIRRSIASVIRDISISMWNVHKNIEYSIKTINIALSINLPLSEIDNFKEDLSKLEEIKQQKEKEGEHISNVPYLETIYGWGNIMYGNTLYFAIFYIPFLPIARYNRKPRNGGYIFYGKLKLHTWQQIWKWGLGGGLLIWLIIEFSISQFFTPSEKYDSNSIANRYYDSLNNAKISNEYPRQFNIDYIGNQLENGATPFANCFKNSIKSGNVTITINNKSNYDAVVFLYSITQDRTVRNVYVRKNTVFVIPSVSEGVYFIRVYAGNGWNPEMEISCGSKGGFQSNVHFYENTNDQFSINNENEFRNFDFILDSKPESEDSLNSTYSYKYFRK